MIIRICYFILLTFSFLSVSGQKRPDPTYFLNSALFDLYKVYLNPARIDSISVNKDTHGGKVFVSTKQRNFTYFTLNDILQKYTKLDNNSNSILFRINGNVVNDVSDIKIDDTYFIYVKTDSLSKIKYIGKKFRALLLVSIDLEKAERKPEIHLRGNQNFMP